MTFRYVSEKPRKRKPKPRPVGEPAGKPKVSELPEGAVDAGEWDTNLKRLGIKPYPMVKYKNGVTDINQNKCTVAQWYNFQIEYRDHNGEPLPEGNYPLPIPKSFDRTKETLRDCVMYGLYFRIDAPYSMTNEEYEEFKKSKENK